MKKREFTQEEINGVIYNYTVLGMGQKRAGEKYHLDDRMVKKILLDNHIHIKSINETNISKYHINDNYFSTQGHNQAYIIGLLGADGNLSSRDNRIDLELYPNDHEILEQIRAELELERPIKIYQCVDGYEKHKLYFHSAKIKHDLMEYGLVPNKTYSPHYQFPYKLKDEYIIDYIRGLFDGDGSVKLTGNYITFQIDCSCRAILDAVQKWLDNKYNIDTRIISEKKANINIYRLYCYGTDARNIFKILYTPNALYLKRKYLKWQELL